MLRRLDEWMAEHNKTWRDVEYMLENNGMNPDSARRKVRRLRKLECKPCPCLMMDIIINMGIPPEQIINTEPF